MGDDIIYVDLNLTQDTTTHPAPISRQVVRTSPILKNAGDYVMAVARASFPQMSIPMWQPTLRLGQMPDISGYCTETIYYITLSYINGGGASVSSDSVPLKVIPSIMGTAVPRIDPAVGLVDQPSDGFNDVFDMDTVVRMHNNAFETAFASLSSKVTLPAGTIAPFMAYNSATQLLSISAFPYSSYQSMNAGTEVRSEGIQIWYSASYYSFLPGWSMKVYNSQTKNSVANGYKDILLTTGGIVGSFTPANGLRQPTDPTQAQIIWMQEWTGFQAFRALMRIQILGSGLNTALESVDVPVVDISKGNNDLQTAIICDFDPDEGIAGGFQQQLVYAPQSIIPGARFIDMLQGVNIQSFTLSVAWLDSLGRSRPMYTFSTSQAASIKLVFVKKSYLTMQSS